MASRWRGRRFVSFGHQKNGGFKAAPNGSSSFGLAVAKRRRVPRSFGFGLRYGSLSPLSFSDWALHLSPWLRPAGLVQQRPVLELYPLETERVRPVRFIGEPAVSIASAASRSVVSADADIGQAIDLFLRP